MARSSRILHSPWRGQGLTAPSFGSTLDFENFYAHHPPIYIFLQAGVFRWLGLSPLSLRGASLLAATLAMITWIACFWRLLRLGWLDRTGFWLCSILYLVEPMIFSLARWERMDSLVNLLVAGSLLLLLILEDCNVNEQKKPATRNWLGLFSAILLGFALSTHLQAVAAWLVWACLVYALRRRFSRAFPIFLVILPGLVFITVWLGTYQESSLAAIRQLWSIASHHTGGLFAYAGNLISSIRNPRQFLQSAPLAGIIVVAGWLLASIVLLRSRHQVMPAALKLEREFLQALCSGLSLALVFILFVSGFNPKHMVTLFPFALIAAGMALKQAGSRGIPIRKTVLISSACLVVACLGIQALTFTTLFSQWNERSPERYMKLSAEISQDAPVAAVPDFWYFFQSKDQPVRIIDYGFPEDRAYWEAHAVAVLPEFDYVLLYPDHPLRDLVSSLSESSQPLSFDLGTYILYKLK